MSAVQFKRIDESHVRVELRGAFVASIERQPNYKRFPWTIHVEGHGRLVDSNADCFTLTEAKQILRRRLA